MYTQQGHLEINAGPRAVAPDARTSWNHDSRSSPRRDDLENQATEGPPTNVGRLGLPAPSL
eukprot:2733814-Pyramimonas_sp.AAC.1